MIDPTKIKLDEKVAFFATANKPAFNDAVLFWKSMVKFNDPKKITMILFTDVTGEDLAKLPKGVQVRDLTPFLEDQMFFYRQKPIISEILLEEFDLVVGFDVDQLVLSDLEDIIKVKTYDVGVVLNWNRFDEKFYPMPAMPPFIQPIEYFNCGMVAVRSKKFVHDWKAWCFGPNFERCQFKEQDGLNLLCHHGNFNVWCFDQPAHKDAEIHCFGIFGKGEWNRAYIEEGKIVVPKGEGPTPWPINKMYVHLAHLGGGSGVPKGNWGQYFQPEVMEYIQKEILK